MCYAGVWAYGGVGACLEPSLILSWFLSLASLLDNNLAADIWGSLQGHPHNTDFNEIHLLHINTWLTVCPGSFPSMPLFIVSLSFWCLTFLKGFYPVTWRNRRQMINRWWAPIGSQEKWEICWGLFQTWRRTTPEVPSGGLFHVHHPGLHPTALGFSSYPWIMEEPQ